LKEAANGTVAAYRMAHSSLLRVALDRRMPLPWIVASPAPKRLSTATFDEFICIEDHAILWRVVE
jgi:hypothetical protein